MGRTTLSRLVGIGCLAGLVVPAARAQDRESFFYAGGRKIPLILHTDIVGFEGEPAAAQVPGTRDYLPGIKAPLDDRRVADLAGWRGVSFVRVQADGHPKVMADLRKTEKVKRVGLAGTIPTAAGGKGKGADGPLVLVTDEFIVGFKPEVKRQAVDALNAGRKAEVVRGLRFVENQFVLRPTDRDPVTALALSHAYHDDRDIRALADGMSHPNLLVPHEARGGQAPNDPLFDRQWHLANTGQQGGQPRADVNALDAWKVTQGEEALVAIIDPFGVDHAHEDLAANRFVNWREKVGARADADRNGFVDDQYGWNFLDQSPDVTPQRRWGPAGAHGTAVAGLACAVAGNRVGGCGVAPKARFLPIVAGRSSEDDADALRYAARMGAHVINCSWGYPIGTPLTDAVERALTEVATTGRDKRGCVVCFAVSNYWKDNTSDISSHPRVIAVGRCTNADLWARCGYGKATAVLAPAGAAHGTRLAEFDPADLAGSLDLTTTDVTPGGYNPGTRGGRKAPACANNPGATEDADEPYTHCFGGTSASAAIVAGVAALVVSANQRLSAEDVRNVLIGTAVRLEERDRTSNGPKYAPDPIGRLHSLTRGYGRVNAGAAVAEAKTKRVGRAPGAPAALVQGPAAGATKPADPAVRIHDRPTTPQEFTLGGRKTTVYCVRNVFALDLRGARQSPADLLKALGDGARPVTAKWAEGFDRTVLLAEAEPDKADAVRERVAGLLEAGTVRSKGWFVFVAGPDGADPQPAVMLDQLVVYFREVPAAADKARVARDHDLDMVQDATGVAPNRVTYRPRDGDLTVTKYLSRLEALQKDGGKQMDPDRTRPVLVPPRDEPR